MIFGDGDGSDGLSNPLEPLENLRKILSGAGSAVTVKRHLPLNLGGIHTIWFVGIQPLSHAEQTELIGFVRNGGGLYLTGERVCCEEENRSDEAIVDRLANLYPLRIGDGNDVDGPYLTSNTVNSNAIDNVGQLPNRLSTWQPSAPGAIEGLTARNALTFAYQGGAPVMTGEVWDGSEISGGNGRLAILMDVNWLEAAYWNPTSAKGMALNLQRFLLGGDFHAQPQGDAYVALGDSYSSGEGNPKFEPYTNTTSDDCHRSEEANGAYPIIVDKDLGHPSFAFVACSGATTGNIWSGGNDPPEDVAKDPEPLQIGALSGATRVVTLTMGGDDVGFAAVLSTCIEHSYECSKEGIGSAPAILRNASSKIKALKGTLEATYKEIQRAAPHARIYVLGYPDVFPQKAPDSGACFHRTFLEPTSIQWLIERQKELDAVVEKAAQNRGVVYVDPNTGAHSFIGHDICSSASWFHGVINWHPTSYSFHPTSTGQENLAAALVTDGLNKGSIPGLAHVTGQSRAPRAPTRQKHDVAEQDDPVDATLGGTVTAVGGGALAGINVYVETSEGAFAGEAETSANGTYAVSGLAAGSYKVEFDPVEQSYEPQWYNGKRTEAEADVIPLAAGENDGEIDAELIPDATISGHVTSESGEPLAGASVYVEQAQGGFAGHAETGADGTYTVSGLRAGDYKIEFSLSQGGSGQYYETQWYKDKPSQGAADVVTIAPGKDLEDIDAALAPDAMVGGVVKASGGGPLAGVEVVARSPEGNGYGSATTAEDGTYTIYGLPAGNYEVEFYANGQYYETQWYKGQSSENGAELIALVSGQNKREVDADLTPDATISGRVTTSGDESLAGVEVYVESADYGIFTGATTDENGEYAVRGLPAGNYKVEFYASGLDYETQWYKDEPSEEKADAIALASGEEATGVDAKLEADATISGKVTVAGGGPLAGVQVDVWSMSGGFEGSETTGEDGTYSVLGLPAGGYKVQFYADGQYYETQWYDDQGSESAADPVILTSGQSRAGVSAALRPDAAVSGAVTAKTGEPLAHVTVRVQSTGSGVSEAAETDSNGRYTVNGLPAGAYSVEFEPNGQHYADRWYDEEDSPEAADTLTLSSGESKTGIDAVLDRTAAAIVGKVTDGQGQPLPGLEVVATDSEGSIVGSGITSEDGTYIVDGLSAGSYTVEFEPGADDYLPQYYSAQDSVTTATPVSLASDAVASHVDAVMQAGATIGGVVTTTEGAPLDDVDVSVYGEGGGFLQAVTTDEDGTYSVSGLPEGSYTVGFEPVSSNYVGQFYDEKAESASATSIVLAAGANKMGVDARLAEGATVKGTVTAEDGSPLENVEVHIQSASGGIGGSAVTDSDGSYSIAGLRPGSYTIQFAPTDGSYAGQYYDNEPEAGEADAVALSAGVTEGIDATLSPGATVSGTVTDEQTHAPVDGVQVSIEPAEGGGESVTTTTGEDGTYSVSDLPPGRYTVAFEPDEAHYVGQYYDEQSGGASASQITLAAGADAEDIDAALVESATITGKVTSAKTGLPVAAATVFVQSAEGDVARTATTGEDGSYSVSGLPTGSYSIEFSAEGQDYLSQFYEDQSEIGSAQAVAVSPGETKAGIDAALADGATVAGTVTDAQSGEPVSGVEVYVRAIEGGFDGVGTTEADGSYSVTGLLPGKYTVQFSPSESNDLGQYYDEKGSIGEADPVTLVAGETKAGVNASLASGAAVSGTVTAAQSGEPLGGIEVDAYTSACDGSGGYALTDAQGAYVIRGLPEGSYHVVFNPGGGSYEAELYSRTISLAKNSNENGTDGALVATSTESPAATLGCIGALVPANLFPPAIDGSAIEGQALTESHGSWSGDPTSFGYQWERCDSSGGACQAMAGATSQVYVLARADVGSTIRVLETAGNAEGSGAPASSAPTAIVQALPVGAEVPRIVVPSSPSSTSSGKASGPPSKRKCSKGKRRKRGKCIKKKHHRKHKKA